MELDAKEEYVHSDFMAFSRGTGIVATLDEKSRDTMKSLVSDLTVVGKGFRGWEVGEKGQLTYISARLPQALSQQPAAKFTESCALRTGFWNRI